MTNLIDRIAPIFGKVPSPEARAALADARKSGATEMYIKYDWVKDWDSFNILVEREEVDLFDGEAGMTVRAT